MHVATTVSCAVECLLTGYLQKYFEGLGFVIPEHMNPADAYLDIISGGILTAAGQTLDIPASWRSKQALLSGGPLAAGAGAAASAGRRRSSMEGQGLAGVDAGSSATVGQKVRKGHIHVADVCRLHLLKCRSALHHCD
jgi:hypothetical protein